MVKVDPNARTQGHNEGSRKTDDLRGDSKGLMTPKSHWSTIRPSAKQLSENASNRETQGVAQAQPQPQESHTGNS